MQTTNEIELIQSLPHIDEASVPEGALWKDICNIDDSFVTCYQELRIVAFDGRCYRCWVTP